MSFWRLGTAKITEDVPAAADVNLKEKIVETAFTVLRENKKIRGFFKPLIFLFSVLGYAFLYFLYTFHCQYIDIFKVGKRRIDVLYLLMRSDGNGQTVGSFGKNL